MKTVAPSPSPSQFTLIQLEHNVLHNWRENKHKDWDLIHGELVSQLVQSHLTTVPDVRQWFYSHQEKQFVILETGIAQVKQWTQTLKSSNRARRFINKIYTASVSLWWRLLQWREILSKAYLVCRWISIYIYIFRFHPRLFLLRLYLIPFLPRSPPGPLLCYSAVVPASTDSQDSNWTDNHIQIIPAILSFRVASLPCTMLVRHCNKRLPISLYCRFIQSSHHVFVMIGCKPRILIPECGQVKALSPVGKEGVLHSSCARIVTI